METTAEKAKAKQKAQAMHNHVVEECQKQNFTFYEFEWLVLMLRKSFGDSIDHLHKGDYDDLFYPIPVDESPKPMFTLVGAPDGGLVIVDVSFPEDPKQTSSLQSAEVSSSSPA